VINKVNPKHLILVCWFSYVTELLSRSWRSKHYIHIPAVGDEIELELCQGTSHPKQVARIEAPQEFEIEVEAEAEGAWIRIPESVVESDPPQMLGCSQ